MAKFLKVLAILLLAVAALGIGGSFVVEGHMAGKAQLIQRVTVDKTADDLFGGEPNRDPIGSPQMMIIEDEKAFIPGPAKDGVRMVDDAYLEEHKIYPLQLRSVRSVAGAVRLGLLLMAVVSALVLVGLKFAARGRTVPHG